jgi:hypothetical protein
MKVFTCTTFDGHHPVGTAAVVIAESEHLARRALDRQLRSQGLMLDPEDEMVELDTFDEQAIVLHNGDY